MKIAMRIEKLRDQLAEAEEQYRQARLKILQQVKIKRNEQSVSLLFKGRVINARKNSWGRFKVTEGKQVLVPEFFGSVHDLRFVIAEGGL